MEFHIKTKISASAQEIYESWMNSVGHTKMTGGEAEITPSIGGAFTAWDGYISGKTLELIPHEKIVQSWRTSEFSSEDDDSIIEIRLVEVNGETELILKHSNLPEHGEQYREGWAIHYFSPMKQYFESRHN